ncbi:MAG: hypothetical protein EOO36_16055, partial [Cytophagaceae bacterium]
MLGSMAALPGRAQQMPAPAAARPLPPTVLTGTVRDAQGQPLELVVVSVEGQPGGATTTPTGAFSL